MKIERVTFIPRPGRARTARPVRIVAASPTPEHASPIVKLRRLRTELARWAKAGMPLAPREVRRQRFAICSACSYYRPTGNLGLGECSYPGCGCTRAKQALATSTCPHKPPKWGPYDAAKAVLSAGQAPAKVP